MKLNFKDRQEIEAIIAAFTETEHEQVYATVKQEVERIKHNPVESAMAVFLVSSGRDIDLVGRAQDGVDAQEMAHKFFWDYLTKFEERALAERVWKSRNSFSEVA